MEEAIRKMEAKIEKMSGSSAIVRRCLLRSVRSEMRVLPLLSPSDLSYGTPAIVPADLEAVGGESSKTHVDRTEDIPSLSSGSKPLAVVLLLFRHPTELCLICCLTPASCLPSPPLSVSLPPLHSRSLCPSIMSSVCCPSVSLSWRHLLVTIVLSSCPVAFAFSPLRLHLRLHPASSSCRLSSCVSTRVRLVFYLASPLAFSLYSSSRLPDRKPLLFPFTPFTFVPITGPLLLLHPGLPARSLHFLFRSRLASPMRQLVLYFLSPSPFRFPLARTLRQT